MKTQPSAAKEDSKKPPAFVRVFTLRFEHPDLGFDVTESDTGKGLQVMNVAENMREVGLKNGFKILELGSYNMREAQLGDWELRIRRCKLPLRVRFKSLPLSKEDETRFRAEIKAKAEAQAKAPKPSKPPDPTIVYCGVAGILILFAVCVYISLMGIPQSAPSLSMFSSRQSRASRAGDPSSSSAPPTGAPFFSGLFGGGDPMAPKPLHKTTFVTLEEMYSGGKISFHPGKLQKICPHCKGTGAAHGHKHNMETCDHCHGAGVVTKKKPGFLGFQSTVEEECPKCGGKGYLVTETCSHCDGTGLITSDEEISLMLPIGTQHGQKLRLRGLGHQVLGYPPGDIILEIRQKPHGVFKRRGKDLTTELKITLKEALTGFTKTIAHLDGHEVRVSSDKIVNQKSIINLPGEGMKSRDGSAVGNLVVRFKVIFPKEFSKAQGAKAKKILRDREGQATLPRGTDEASLLKDEL